MASRGTRFRIPRKVKKARAHLYAHNLREVHLTFRQRRLLSRCLPLSPLGWRGVRHHNAHVAMGDTTTCRLRERRERERAQLETRERRRYGG